MTPSNPIDQDPVGFLFPGQGAQAVGMGHDLADRFTVAAALFAEADRRLGFSLRDLCIHGPDDRLNQDVNAQLALYTVSCIIADILKSHSVNPRVCAGYSSGFYAAAYAAGCFDFAQGLGIVRNAGEILLEEGRRIDGGMAVIFGLSADRVGDILHRVNQVDMAIMNTPRQIVVSGIKSRVREVMNIALREGALDAYPLPVATAYHSRFMASAGRRLRRIIDSQTLRSPSVPLFSYTTLAPVVNAASLADVMAHQLSRPVFWVDLIKELRHKGVGRMIEVGSGAMLSRTVRWIDRTIDMMPTNSLAGILKVIETASPHPA